MKIQIASDIHLEFYYRTERKVTRTIQRIPRLADTIMLAGDIHVPHEHFTNIIFSEFCKIWKKVFYVPGNHDYWHFDSRVPSKYDWAPRDADKRLQFFIDLENKFPNLSVLRTGKVVEYLGKRFLGDTMWFPDHPYNFSFKKLIHDFEKISGFEPWVYKRNSEFKSFLNDHLRKGDVVMTHHLPSHCSVHINHKTDPENRFYVSNMDNEISNLEPAVWIHGHNHALEDQVLGQTRLLSCPKGYPGEYVKGFDKGMVVDI